MSMQTLRELAKGYAKGSIGKEKYRQSRSELLRGIIAGNIDVQAIDYEAPLKPPNEIAEAITEGIKRDKTEITSPQQRQANVPKKPTTTTGPVSQKTEASKNNTRSPLIYILISIIIIISLIVLVVLFYPKPPESSSIKTSTNPNETNIVNSTTTIKQNGGTGETLIANFLSEKNWGEDSLNNFVDSWSALSEKQRASVNQSKRMKRMNDSIYKQFLEEKALASIDSENAVENQKKLIDFANSLGLNDTRLVLD